MTDLKKLTANLEKKGYIVRYFDTPQEAADYLDSRINGKTVAFGGSMTLKSMELYPKLSSHNQVVWALGGGRPDGRHVHPGVPHLCQRGGRNRGAHQH